MASTKSTSRRNTRGGTRTRSRRYGAKASEKVEKSMREMKRGTLRSGSGKKITDSKQAIAIGLSEARRAGGKVPSRAKSSSKAKSPARKRSSSSRSGSSSGRSRTAASRSRSRKK
jgi:hypothetical protein